MPVYADREERLNQGDIFPNIPFSIPHGAERSVEQQRGMVISHDCDCDKFFSEQKRGRAHEPAMWPITVAPVYLLSDLKGGQAGDAEKGRIRRFFYLPPEGEHEAQVADLWFEQPISVLQLLEGTRHASLSDEWRQRLHVQMWELRTRIPFAEAFDKGSL